MDNFKGKIVLVTGAASGIGRQTAYQFASAGAIVVGADMNNQGLEETASRIGENFIGKLCDVTSIADIEKLSVDVKKQFDCLDCLINNAGTGWFVHPLEITEDDFSGHYNLLIRAPMFMAKYFVPLLKKASTPAIVNIASIAAINNQQYHYLYSTAKAALVKYTQNMAVEFPEVRSNVILPGVIRTPASEAMAVAGYPIEESIIQRTSMRRMGETSDIANCIMFLCSEKASYITGASIVVDGGLVCRQSAGEELGEEMLKLTRMLFDALKQRNE